MAKEFAKQFYNSKAWREVRELRIGMDRGICQICGKPGNEVDHIIELTPDNIYDEMIALNLDNLRTLCHRCHTRKTMQGQRSKEDESIALDRIFFTEDGMPVKAMPPLNRE
jgi:5-methylcytosine-specific restriction endonuclease McrA